MMYQSKEEVGTMLNYMLSFGALALITYLAQFNAYRQSRA